MRSSTVLSGATRNCCVIVRHDDLHSTVELARTSGIVAGHGELLAIAQRAHPIGADTTLDDGGGHRVCAVLRKLLVEVVRPEAVGESFDLHAAFRILVKESRDLIERALRARLELGAAGV